MAAPDSTHLLIEALLRGIPELLPTEGWNGWAVDDSAGRNELTKIVRILRNDTPCLVFERLGRPLNFWTLPGAIDLDRCSSCTAVERTRGFIANGSPAVAGRPGWHSNVDVFFGKPDQLWFFQFSELTQAFRFLEAFK